MAKHAYNHRSKRIVEVDEFAQHLADLKNRIRGVNIRTMIRNS